MPRPGRRSRGGPTAGAGADRLGRGVDELRVGSGRWSTGERTLLVAGGVLAPVGVIVVLLGWFGAARTPNLHEQIPYLISGGLLGLALVFLGGFLYFAHWVTQVVREQRAGTAAVVEAVQRLADAVEAGRPPAAPPMSAAGGNGGGPDGAGLVATGAGTLAHRPTCRVVAGKPGLRPVRAGEDLAPCRLCNPYS